MTLICILEAHVSSKNAQGVGKRIKKAQCAFHVHYLVSIVIPILIVKTVLWDITCKLTLELVSLYAQMDSIKTQIPEHVSPVILTVTPV
jgi:hypothetical protein